MQSRLTGNAVADDFSAGIQKGPHRIRVFRGIVGRQREGGFQMVLLHQPDHLRVHLFFLGQPNKGQSDSCFAVAASADYGSGFAVKKGLQHGLCTLVVCMDGSVYGGGCAGTEDPAAVVDAPDNGTRREKTEQNAAQYKASNSFILLYSLHIDSSTSQWALPIAGYTV